MAVKKKSGSFTSLTEALKQFEDQKLLVALRGAPDPDSISSALAHQLIAESLGIETEVAYSEDISHQENKALMKVLGIDFIKYAESMDFSEYAGYCLVDSQHTDQVFEDALKGTPLITVVDHHDKEEGLEAKFVNVDADAGAAATIYAETLKEMDLLKESSEDNSDIATALMHGIRTDSDNLLNATTRDFEAMSYLSRFADPKQLRKISIQAVSPGTMDAIALAAQNRKTQDNYLISGVRILEKSDRDALPQAADFLLRRAGIDTVLVYGIIGDSIQCSFRTTSDTIRPADFIEETFPEVEPGDYGGRYDKGGFSLSLGPFGDLNDNRNEELLVKVVDTYMMKRFNKAVGSKEEKSS
jgi:nanoRNase/pAp phosphatase (c-di-AMP/oligoRNAs hydrolase)